MLTEYEKKKLKDALYSWQFTYTSDHNRGCFLEALAGEFERGTITKEYLIEVLLSIATLMK